jgi:hypothetical protein
MYLNTGANMPSSSPQFRKIQDICNNLCQKLASLNAYPSPTVCHEYVWGPYGSKNGDNPFVWNLVTAYTRPHGVIQKDLSWQTESTVFFVYLQKSTISRWGSCCLLSSNYWQLRWRQLSDPRLIPTIDSQAQLMSLCYPIAGVLNLVLFWYWLVLFDIFINCWCFNKHFLPVLAGER